MKRDAGFLIIEVLIAIVILSTVLLSIFSLIRSSQIKDEKTNFGSEMMIVTQNGIEIAADNLKNNFDLPIGTYYPVFDSGANTWSLIATANAETNIETRYTRIIRIQSVCRDYTGEISQSTPCPGKVDENSKLITVDVGWVNTSFGKPLSANLLVVKMDK